jgi:hypothetical protein
VQSPPLRDNSLEKEKKKEREREREKENEIENERARGLYWLRHYRAYSMDTRIVIILSSHFVYRFLHPYTEEPPLKKNSLKRNAIFIARFILLYTTCTNNNT